MLKKPLFFSIFFVLFIGLSDYGYGCHNGDQHGKKPCDGGDEDTTGGKPKSIALIMKFDDYPGDNVQSDEMTPYVDEEGAGVGAAERSQPNPAAGIGLGLNATKKRHGRQLFLDITCEGIDFTGYGIEDLNKCEELPAMFPQLFPTCGENNFCSLGASVRPYKVSCPGVVEANAPCPDVFTMDSMKTELMNFRLAFGGGELLIEVASAIGGEALWTLGLMSAGITGASLTSS